MSYVQPKTSRSDVELCVCIYCDIISAEKLQSSNIIAGRINEMMNSLKVHAFLNLQAKAKLACMSRLNKPLAWHGNLLKG